MKFFIKLGAAGDTPETPDTPPTENAPLHRGKATEITETHQYIYAGGKLLRETISDATTTKTLDFTYDNVGMPYSLIYNNGTTTATYYYITNLQGDVMYLVDANGVQVAAYDYDPYGKIISATGDLAEINPLRYRGYYYDTETGFYYLQSRYYDPEICRFINGDKYSATATGFLGYNMFAYCNNNPIIAADYDGEWLNIVIGAVVGAVIGAATTAIDAYKTGGWDAFSSGKTWAKMGVSAAIGAVSGGVAATGLGVVLQAGISATATAVGDIATQMIDNNSCSLSRDNIDYHRAFIKKGGEAFALSVAGSVAGNYIGKYVTKTSVKSDELFDQYLYKSFSASQRQAVGRSSSALLRQAGKYLAQSRRYDNITRGVGSVVGSLMSLRL